LTVCTGHVGGSVLVILLIAFTVGLAMVVCGSIYLHRWSIVSRQFCLLYAIH